jgi:hypothetical protein
MDGRFLPNPLDVTESPGVTPPEPEGRVKSPPRNVAEKGYGGEDATVTPTRHKGIEHYKLDLPVECRGQEVFRDSNNGPWGPDGPPQQDDSRGDTLPSRIGGTTI